MKLPHTPWHWMAVAAVLAIALFTLGEARGQSTGAAATFEGRPAVAGAQAGTGAMAGPPQGGLGPQGVDQPGGGVTLRAPAAVTGAPAGAATPGNPGAPGLPGNAGPDVPRDPGVAPPASGNGAVQPRRDRDSGNVLKRQRDRGGLDEQGSVAGKGKRAAKRTVERARRGVGGIDS